MSHIVYMPNQEQAARTIVHGHVSAQAITPSDSTILKQTRGLYVGTAGDVAVTMADGTAITLNALVAGQVHPLSVTQVKATGTTATNIVAFY